MVLVLFRDKLFWLDGIFLRGNCDAQSFLNIDDLRRWNLPVEMDQL